MEFMPLLPHGIQARMVDILNKSVWFSLREDGLSTSPGDVFLKHGSNIAGDWNVVGIVDALPSNGYQPKSPFEDGMQKAIADLGSNLRPAFGRPNDAWGMTPLLIFREVSET